MTWPGRWASTPWRSPPPATWPRGRPTARSAGHRSSASCWPSPRSRRRAAGLRQGREGELLAFAKVAKIFGLETALANLAGVAPAEDRDVVAGALAKTFGKTVAPLALGRQI
jgi:hypothetical protein